MTCRWDHDTNDYLNNGEPCRVDDYGDPTKHCTARRSCSSHVGRDELTCARCMGRTRSHLRRIPLLATLMMPVALGAGVNSQAANLAGPAADPEAWSWRKIAARQGKAWHLSLIEDDDEQHPYTVLVRWAQMIAEDYGHDAPEVWTVSNAAAYLERQLPRIAQDGGQDFPLMTTEVRRCRRHLETTMTDGDAAERGLVCPECLAAMRDKRAELAERGVPEGEWPKMSAPKLVRRYSHWCEDPECRQQFHSTDDSQDRWVCPRDPAHVWDVESYDKYLTERRGA